VDDLRRPRCRPEMESAKAWDRYIRTVGEQEAADAIGEAQRLARNFARKHDQTGDRMMKLFEAGKGIYAERFGRDWVPF
jgi:hypothetical protein